MRTSVVINPAVPMKQRLDMIDTLSLFLAGQDHPPTEREITAFVEELGDAKRKEFLIVMILDATAGMRPPTIGRPS